MNLIAEKVIVESENGCTKTTTSGLRRALRVWRNQAPPRARRCRRLNSSSGTANTPFVLRLSEQRFPRISPLHTASQNILIAPQVNLLLEKFPLENIG